MKPLADEISWDRSYAVAEADDVLTPALVIYPELVAANIRHTLDLLQGNAGRWRPHIKTAKLGWTLRALAQSGVRNVKCATSLELRVGCESGMEDVLVAYPVMGANAQRILEVAALFPRVRVSALVERAAQVEQWRGSTIGIFVDLNPGMDRTGAPMNVDGVLGLIETIRRARLEFRGLHYYDGQLGNIELEERTKRAHAGYDRLLELVDKLEQAGHAVGEVITAGTPTLPCSIAYRGFSGRNFLHRVSPGTVVYSDATSLAQLPEYAYKPAAVVLTRVVSHPRTGVVTCDAGHKSVAADAGVPTCVVLGHPELRPLAPSEEHLPMAVETGAQAPEIGEVLLVVPRHVCPTINNFDHALLVERGNIREVAPVSARGREAPLLKGVSAAR